VSTRQRPRSRSGRRLRPARIIAGVLAGAVLAASAVGYAASTRYFGKVEQVSVFADLGDRPEPVDGAAEALNVLLVASDDRTGLSHKERKKLAVGQDDYGRHTDTMMLLHIAEGSDHVTAMSLPRDSLVTIPEYVGDDGKTRTAHQAKLNAAFGEGGGALLVRTIEDATDIRINHYLEVDFEGFLNIVDALGGVEVCLSDAAVDPKAGLDLPAGRQTVDGPQALAYVRTRSLDATADIGRIQRQQKFLAAMVQKATSAGTLLNPLAFDRLASAAAESLTTDETLDAAGLMKLAQRMRGVDPKSITFLTVPVADYNYRVDALGSTLLWDDAQADALFAKIRADEPLVDPAAPKVSVSPEAITVQVLNAAGVPGLATTAQDDLVGMGFVAAGDPGNAKQADATTTVIKYDPEWDVSVKTLAAALPYATLQESPGLGSTMKVLIGSDYDGVTAVKVEQSGAAGERVRSADEDICD
jgi:LCP family protein required for cell wall assembly